MATLPRVYWHGTSDEAFALVDAIVHNCECSGYRVCEPHRALAEDQRWLNGILFVRQLRQRLLAEEFMPAALAE